MTVMAEKLNCENTHVVGTLRANRRGNPRDVISKKLKKGELFAQQSSSNIVVMKWRDKRDIYLITTKHTDETIEIRRRTGDIIKKPLAVEDYNAGKSFIDRSDQMASYSNSLKRSIKWYRKVAFDILLLTVVNALPLYKSVTMNNITITRFKQEIIKPLLFKPTVSALPVIPTSHKLISCGNLKKRMCQKCYSRLSSEFGRKVAQNKTRKILTRCEGCNIFMCRDCFIKFHKSIDIEICCCP